MPKVANGAEMVPSAESEHESGTVLVLSETKCIQHCAEAILVANVMRYETDARHR